MKKNVTPHLGMILFAVCLMNLQFGILPIQASTEFSAIYQVQGNLTPVAVSDWGQWTQGGFSGLDYRVRCEGYNNYSYKWNVQFRNRYKDKIHFGWEISDNNAPVTRTTNRTTLSSGGISDIGFGKSLNTSCGSGNAIYVYVDSVRFGENDSGPYAKPN